jgi:hypothetical protein
MSDVAVLTDSTHPARTSRSLVFISHATPDDNEFVLWLGTRLTALGYDVWADIRRSAWGLLTLAAMSRLYSVNIGTPSVGAEDLLTRQQYRRHLEP